MTSSTLRFVIIVALVVSGVFVISRAFQEPVPPSSGAGGGAITSPTPSTSLTKPPKATESPKIAGVVLGVYNGTDVTGLAGETALKLEKKYEYDVPASDVGDTPTKPVPVTTLYYRTAQDKIEAEALASSFFKGLDVQVQKLEAGTDIPRDVQVAVYLGNDYAATVE